MRNTILTLIILIFSMAGSAQKAPETSWVSSPMAPQYFAVAVGDMDRSVSWYRTVFGLKQLDDQKDPKGVWRIVNLTSDALFIELIWDSRCSKQENARGFAKVGFSVTDVREIAKRAESATGEKPRVIEFEKHKLRILQLRDPDGNVLQFASPLDGRTATD